MAQATLLELQVDQGQCLLDRLRREQVPVTAAGWVKENESGDWYLYLATPLVSEEGAKRAAYHRVNAVIREMQKEGIILEPLDKKVIGPQDPIAQDMIAHRNGRQAGTLTYFRGARLGDLAVDEAFIYPPTLPGEAAEGSES